ncbi:hypothetical protein H0H92_007680, partial [Tricholoma furcatifolium]
MHLKDPTRSDFLADSQRIRLDSSAAGGNGPSLSEIPSNSCKMNEDTLPYKTLIPEHRALLKRLIMEKFNSMSNQIKWDSQGNGNTLREVVALVVENAVDQSWCEAFAGTHHIPPFATSSANPISDLNAVTHPHIQSPDPSSLVPFTPPSAPVTSLTNSIRDLNAVTLAVCIEDPALSSSPALCTAGVRQPISSSPVLTKKPGTIEMESEEHRKKQLVEQREKEMEEEETAAQASVETATIKTITTTTESAENTEKPIEEEEEGQLAKPEGPTTKQQQPAIQLQTPSRSAWEKDPPKPATTKPQQPATKPPISSRSAWEKGPPKSTSVPSPRSQSSAPSHSRRPSTLGQGVPIKDGATIPRGNASALKAG